MKNCILAIGCTALLIGGVDSARAELMEVYNIRAGDSLNVRLGPGSDKTDIGDLLENEIVNVLGYDASGKWAQIRYQGQLAWVSARYLRAVSQAPSGTGQHFVTGISANDPDGGLVVRAGGGKSFSRIGVLPQGTGVHVIERTQDGKWAMIAFGQGVGYVSTAYLGDQPQASSPQPSQGGGFYAVTGIAQNDRLNWRAEPDPAAPILGSFAPGETIFVNGSATGNWVRVTLNGQIGYVKSRYLTRQQEPDQTQTLNGFPLGISCRGTEPFWTLTIAQDRTVTYNELNSGTDPLASLTLASPSVGGGYPFDFVAGPYSGSLNTETCSDGMSDISYTMRIVFDRALPGGWQNTHYGCCNLD